MQQLPLDMTLPPRYGEEDFMVSECNESAWKAIAAWDEQQVATALIKGSISSGRTHLASIWAARNDAGMMEALQLSEQFDPESLFTDYSCLVIRNIEQIRNPSALFHLLNFQRQSTQTRLMLTVDQQACWGGFALPDLRSRLQALPQVLIEPLDDQLLMGLLVKNFHDRQIEISQASLDYILPRIERSSQAVITLVRQVDEAAMSQKRPITRSLIQEILR